MAPAPAVLGADHRDKPSVTLPPGLFGEIHFAGFDVPRREIGVKEFAAQSFVLAEGVGFEPTVGLPQRLISSQVPLTTQPPFHLIFKNFGVLRAILHPI